MVLNPHNEFEMQQSHEDNKKIGAEFFKAQNRSGSNVHNQWENSHDEYIFYNHYLSLLTFDIFANFLAETMINRSK